MIGRGAQGRPWVFRELVDFYRDGNEPAPLAKNELRDIMLDHLKEMHRFYGEPAGVRVARKHLTWYCKNMVDADDYRYQVVRSESGEEQLRLTQEYFDRSDGGVLFAV
jgi:tRNA-dihydrouridine synthase B